jgi:DNA-binding transcriptional LysR family regulator
MLPNPNDLRFLIEVSNTLNLSRAAERLGVTQPALSQGMKRLEICLGQQILLRSKGGVALTKAGEKFCIKARTLLDDWELLKNDAQRDAEEIRGRYSLGMHASVALFTTPYFIPSLLEEYEDLEFHLAHDLSRKMTEDVISFKLDFAIVVNPVSHPDLVIRELFKDEVCFWKSKKTCKNNDIESEKKVLLVEPDLKQTQDLLGRLKKKTQFGRTVSSDNLEVIKSLVINGAGIGILPGRVVGEDAKKLEIIEALPKFSDRICMIYRADMQKSLAARNLLRLIQEKLKGR